MSKYPRRVAGSRKDDNEANTKQTVFLLLSYHRSNHHMKQLWPVLLLLTACTAKPKTDNRPIVFVGTYTEDLGFVQGKAAGIYTCRLDTVSGALEITDTTGGIANPSFLAISPDKKYLYAVAENGGKPDKPFGSVVAYRIETGGRLVKINEVPSYGAAPCHVSTDASGKYVLIANYVTGNVVSYSVNPDGSLSDSLSAGQHPGATPWAHMIIPAPSGPGRILAVDKGADQVFLYDLEAGKLRRIDSLRLSPGAGPRHFDFHPADPSLGFVINENSCSIASVRFDTDGLRPAVLDSLSTLPAGFKGKNTCADIHVHPNGRFVYGSNRGHNSIAIFGVDAASGKLTLVGHESTQGALPRNFMITPDGKMLLAANQNSDNVVAFRIDPASGKLTPTGANSRVPTPVCLKMW